MRREQPKALTVERIRKAAPNDSPYWLTDGGGPRGGGRLVVLVATSGSKSFYYRYAPAKGKRATMSLGPFSSDPKPGFLTLAEARAKALELGALNRADDSRDVRRFLDAAEQAKRDAEEAEARRIDAEREAAEAARAYTLRALAAEYAATLERRGKKRSSLDARNLFKNHLNDKAIADRVASEVSRADIAALVRELTEPQAEGAKRRPRQAGKLRSYLHAAYSMAMHAEGDADAPAAMIAFKVTTNPVAETKVPKGNIRARNRTLTDTELAHYWQRLAKVQGESARGALQLALLLGGQRIAQLLRLRRTDVDLAAGELTIYDPKGRRNAPRANKLPVAPAAKAILQPLIERAAAMPSDWVFPSDGGNVTTEERGRVAVEPGTLSRIATGIAAAMKKEGEASTTFLLADIRRTAETMLARMGVSKDLRAQILSHGISGVQATHYDRHGYMDEKRKALRAWARKVTAKLPKGAKTIQSAGVKSSTSLG